MNIKKNSKIEAAGLLQRLLSELKKSLKRYGMELLDSMKESDGSVTHKLSCVIIKDGDDPETVEFYMNGRPNEDKSEVNLSFKYKDLTTGEEIVDKDKYTNVKNEQGEIVKYCMKFIRDVFKGDSLEDIPEDLTANETITGSKLMRLRLKKVKSSTGYSAELQSISATYDPMEVKDDLNILLSDSSIVDSLLTDEFADYTATVNNDLIEINLDTDCDTCCADYLSCAYDCILNCAYDMYFNVEMMKYTACGTRMKDIKSISETYSWMLKDLIDTTTIWMIEDSIDIVNPILRIQGLDPQSCYINNVTYFENFYEEMSKKIQVLIDTLNLYAVNLEESKYLVVKQWVRNWLCELNYVLARNIY